MTVANSLVLTGGGIVPVGPIPVAVQVTGSTIAITNLGNNHCFGSCGGSGASTVSISGVTGAGFATGQPVGGTGGGNTSTATAGILIPAFPGAPVFLNTGGNTWLWLATLGGQTSVNVANVS